MSDYEKTIHADATDLTTRLAEHVDAGTLAGFVAGGAR